MYWTGRALCHQEQRITFRVILSVWPQERLQDSGALYLGRTRRGEYLVSVPPCSKKQKPTVR